MKKKELPDYLSKENRLWAEKILAEWELEAHQIKILVSAAECLDRINECRAAIKTQGAFFEDRFGQIRPHPALVEERNHRLAFARLVRELNLSAAPPDSRPPTLEYPERSD